VGQRAGERSGTTGTRWGREGEGDGDPGRFFTLGLDWLLAGIGASLEPGAPGT
jgi:hypothetical protein